ncbi:MAG TPA: heavy-metal-associated domain-containing protein [Bacteroidota bacterium]|nr:heavy-metal-associated domain-containing protein [Bacteroidota bacterium]
MRQNLLAAISVLGLFAGCTKTGPPRETPAVAQISTATINLPTLKCKTCVKTISGALESLDGIEDVDVDLPSKKATVRFVASKLDAGRIRKRMSEAGYTADGVERDSAAYEALPECCK